MGLRPINVDKNDTTMIRFKA